MPLLQEIFLPCKTNAKWFQLRMGPGTGREPLCKNASMLGLLPRGWIARFRWYSNTESKEARNVRAGPLAVRALPTSFSI